MTHTATVHPHQRDWRDRPIGWYMACDCGYCGPQRRSEGMAHHDMAAHLAAVERARTYQYRCTECGLTSIGRMLPVEHHPHALKEAVPVENPTPEEAFSG